MRQCWLSIPDDRPTFSSCRRKIGRELTRCSIDYYKELLNLLKIDDDNKSDSPITPAPIGCQRFSSNSSQYDARTRFFSTSDNKERNLEDTAANSAYFDCSPGPSSDELEMRPLTGQNVETKINNKNSDSGSSSS